MKRFSKEALEALNKEVLSDNSDMNGNYFTLRRKELADNETVAIRIIPAIVGKNSSAYFFKKIGWFVQPDDEFKYLLSMKSFGEDCNVSSAMNKLSEKHPDWEALFASGGDAFKQSVTYLIPCLVLDNIVSKKGDIQSYEIRNNKVCVFEAPLSVITAINGLMMDPAYDTDADDGFLDREEGFVLYITKVVQKKKTSYKVTCSRNPNEIAETEFYETEFDLLSEMKKAAHSNQYITAVLKGYATGSTIPDPTYMIWDDEENEEEEEKPKAKKEAKKEAKTTKEVTAKPPVEDDEDEDDAPPPKPSKKPEYKSKLLSGSKSRVQEEEE